MSFILQIERSAECLTLLRTPRPNARKKCVVIELGTSHYLAVEWCAMFALTFDLAESLLFSGKHYHQLHVKSRANKNYFLLTEK